MRPLRILHVLRAPVGGLFRHVLDLAGGQVARGHQVGIIAAESDSAEAEARLATVAPKLALGVTRLPIRRHLGPSDYVAARRVAARANEAGAEVLHGHGGKGGAYARLAFTPALRVYTPHGGSLHYSRRSPVGFLYLALERLLLRRTDLALFESEFAEGAFGRKVGAPAGLIRVVHNGIGRDELAPITPDREAADFVYVGELRKLKGVESLLDALALLAKGGTPITAVLYGDGPDRGALIARAAELGLADRVRFLPPRPARAALRTGRTLIVPSIAESLPYVVLEAIGAGVPVIATRVGGIPEIFGPDADALVAPGDPAALAAAMRAAPAAALRSERLQARVAASFNLDAMVEGVLAAYAAALSARSRIHS